MLDLHCKTGPACKTQHKDNVNGSSCGAVGWTSTMWLMV